MHKQYNLHIQDLIKRKVLTYPANYSTSILKREISNINTKDKIELNWTKLIPNPQNTEE